MRVSNLRFSRLPTGVKDIGRLRMVIFGGNQVVMLESTAGWTKHLAVGMILRDLFPTPPDSSSSR